MLSGRGEGSGDAGPLRPSQQRRRRCRIPSRRTSSAIRPFARLRRWTSLRLPIPKASGISSLAALLVFSSSKYPHTTGLRQQRLSFFRCPLKRETEKTCAAPWLLGEWLREASPKALSQVLFRMDLIVNRRCKSQLQSREERPCQNRVAGAFI